MKILEVDWMKSPCRCQIDGDCSVSLVVLAAKIDRDEIFGDWFVVVETDENALIVIETKNDVFCVPEADRTIFLAKWVGSDWFDPDYYIW